MPRRTFAAVIATITAISSCSPDSASPTTAGTARTDSPTTTEPAVTSTTATAATPTSAEQMEHPVVQFDGAVVDPARDRRIPYRIYAPADAGGAVPVILVSHGGDGNERGYTSGAHLGRTFARGGFLAVHIGHRPSTPGSRQVVDRPADVTFVLDRLEDGTLPLPPDWEGTADIDRVGHRPQLRRLHRARGGRCRLPPFVPRSSRRRHRPDQPARPRPVRRLRQRCRRQHLDHGDDPCVRPHRW